MKEINLRPQIFKERPDVEFYLKNPDGSRGVMINASQISLDTNGKYVTVLSEEGETYISEDIITEQLFLEVPGIGYLRPGTLIVLTGDLNEYELKFGWHTNASNQTINGWYLRPISEVVPGKDSREYMSTPCKRVSTDRTLYKEMLNKIWKAGTCNEEIYRHYGSNGR